MYFQKENIPIGPPEKKRNLFLRYDNPKQTPAPKSNGFEMLSVLSTKKQGEESVQAGGIWRNSNDYKWSRGFDQNEEW